MFEQGLVSNPSSPFSCSASSDAACSRELYDIGIHALQELANFAHTLGWPTERVVVFLKQHPGVCDRTREALLNVATMDSVATVGSSCQLLVGPNPGPCPSGHDIDHLTSTITGMLRDIEVVQALTRDR